MCTPLAFVALAGGASSYVSRKRASRRLDRASEEADEAEQEATKKIEESKIEKPFGLSRNVSRQGVPWKKGKDGNVEKLPPLGRNFNLRVFNADGTRNVGADPLMTRNDGVVADVNGDPTRPPAGNMRPPNKDGTGAGQPGNELYKPTPLGPNQNKPVVSPSPAGSSQPANNLPPPGGPTDAIDYVEPSEISRPFDERIERGNIVPVSEMDPFNPDERSYMEDPAVGKPTREQRYTDITPEQARNWMWVPPTDPSDVGDPNYDPWQPILFTNVGA